MKELGKNIMLNLSTGRPDLQKLAIAMARAQSTINGAKRRRALCPIYKKRFIPIYRRWSLAHIKAEWRRAKKGKATQKRHKHYDYVSRCPATGGNSTVLGDTTHAIR